MIKDLMELANRLIRGAGMNKILTEEELEKAVSDRHHNFFPLFDSKGKDLADDPDDPDGWNKKLSTYLELDSTLGLRLHYMPRQDVPICEPQMIDTKWVRVPKELVEFLGQKQPT